MSNDTKRNVVVPRNSKAVQEFAEWNTDTFLSDGYPDEECMDKIIDGLIRYEVVDSTSTHAYDDAAVLAQNSRIRDGLKPFYNTSVIMLLNLENVAKEAPETLDRLNAWNDQTYCDRIEKRTTVSLDYLQNQGDLSKQAFDFSHSKDKKPKGNSPS